jgi:hypothetical protein
MTMLTPAGVQPDTSWRGRRPPRNLPWLTRTGAWNAWNRGSLIPCFDLDSRKHRRPGWLPALWSVVLFGCLLAYAAWAVVGGRT